MQWFECRKQELLCRLRGSGPEFLKMAKGLKNLFSTRQGKGMWCVAFGIPKEYETTGRAHHGKLDIALW